MIARYISARRLRASNLIVACLVVIMAVVALAGVSIWPLIFAAAFPWFLVLATRKGAAISLGVVVLGSLWLMLAVMLGLPLLQLPLLATFVVAWTGIGLAGAAILRPCDLSRRAWSRDSIVVWFPAALGSLVWIAAVVVSNFIDGAPHYSWAMTGDSANNVLFARDISDRPGLAIGPDQNPVPLPAVLIALGISAGRASIPSAALLKHDMAGVVVLWILLIAATCYLAGVAAARAARGSRRWIIAVVGAGVSLVPLSWFATGLAIEYGFFSVGLAYPIVFICWIIALEAERSPVIVLVMMFMASTLLLAVWSPLVLVPVALGVMTVAVGRHEFARLSGARLVVLAVALLQLLLYGASITLPGLMAQGGALAAQGAMYVFRQRIIIGVLCVGGAAVVALLLARERLRAWALLAVLASCGVGLAVLLFVSRNGTTPWSYYPLKLAWMTSVIGLVLILGVAGKLIGRLVSPRVVSGVLLVVIAVATVIALGWTSSGVPGYPWMNPLDRILGLNGAGSEPEAVAAEVFSLVDADHPVILWESGNKAEGAVNFWSIQMRAGIEAKSHSLRTFAYVGYDTSGVEDLCRIVDLMGGTVTVRTINADLSSELLSICPGVRANIVVGPTP